MPTFIVHTPVGANQIVMKREIQEAVSRATKEGKLRTNSVDSLTERTAGTISARERRLSISSSGSAATSRCASS